MANTIENCKKGNLCQKIYAIIKYKIRDYNITDIRTISNILIAKYIKI